MNSTAVFEGLFDADGTVTGHQDKEFPSGFGKPMPKA